MRAGPAEGTTHAPHRSRRVCRVQLVAFWQRFDSLSTASPPRPAVGLFVARTKRTKFYDHPTPPTSSSRSCTNLSEFGSPQIDLGSISRFGVETLRHRLHPQNFGPLTKPRPRPPKLPAGQIRCRRCRVSTQILPAGWVVSTTSSRGARSKKISHRAFEARRVSVSRVRCSCGGECAVVQTGPAAAPAPQNPPPWARRALWRGLRRLAFACGARQRRAGGRALGSVRQHGVPYWYCLHPSPAAGGRRPGSMATPPIHAANSVPS